MGGDQGQGTVVEVAYALAWDLEACALWRPLTVEAARERDAAGLPYVVVYRIPGREVPLEVRLVSWRDHYVGLWVYDDQGRRTDELDLRLLDDQSRLLRRRTRRWQYTGPEMAEFDDECPRSVVELFPDGRGSITEAPRGERGRRLVTVPDADTRRWQDRPGFEDWPVAAARWRGLPGPVELQAAALDSGTVETPRDASEAPATCWRPPRPAQPGLLDALFRAGTRVTDGFHPEMTVVEPLRTGTLRVPSGLLAVSGPDSLSDEGPAITVPVPPGEYVLEEAQVRFGYDCEWSQGWVTRTETTAVRLRISDTPAASWEMGLGPDDDPRLLGENEIFGFDTDGATGCFADAGAWESLRRLFERHVVGGEPGVGEDTPDSMYLLRTRDEASGGELVAFATTGDGTYPVWVGRSADGDVAEVVVLVEGMPTVLRDGTADGAEATLV
ncbi:DUF4241 domain-containing protein [Streptomyces neyagawaensis]|uniref:DUF4241 domain-containing protein n=1 Tax=Streptomyces neyagawaensis TaxID=42238 RepID=UPI0006E3FCB3|nr:DUF4241 domain-containing protein [Streptomyces neyagawaensis]MCL6735934.1 DUF4241 domain-containing protein [Streptomyces neyagawaensis]MDE1686851.1 DUF4241 domain-containing protein [Streptomyces neyagawaensis]